MEEKENIQKKTNGFAIAGFICSLVVGTITGLIFSIIGLVKAKKCNSGKGFGIAGIIISILRLLLIIAIIGISFYIVSNNAAGQSAFCDEIYEDRETACTLNTDGTYDCIFATCDYSDRKRNTNSKNEVSKKDEIKNNKSKKDSKTGENSHSEIQHKPHEEVITAFDETIPSLDTQKNVFMHYLVFYGDNVKSSDLTNAEKLTFIQRMYDFENMSGKDILKASQVFFESSVDLEDTIDPKINKVIFEYNEDKDILHYTCGDCFGTSGVLRIEKTISETENDGMLIIETSGVITASAGLGPIGKIYYDYGRQNEIPVDSKYYEEGQNYFCGDCVNKFIEDNKDSLPHYEYKFRVNGNYLTFIEVSRTR